LIKNADKRRNIMDSRLEFLASNILLSGKAKKFKDIEGFLKHIFEWDSHPNSLYEFDGYHSEYIHKGQFNLKINRKYIGGAYHVTFADNKKGAGSIMFPIDLSPEMLIKILLSNLTEEDYKKKFVNIELESGLVIKVCFDNGKIFSAITNENKMQSQR